MPIHAEADFCGGGFAFAMRMHVGGVPCRCFAPSVKWFGTCTCREHTDACKEVFHHREFVMPAAVGARVLARVGDRARREYMRGVACWGHLAYVCANVEGIAGVVRSRAREMGGKIDAADLRVLLRMGGVGYGDVSGMTVEPGDTADNHAVSMCRAWRGGMKLPYDFDRRCFAAACLAVMELPTEVRLLILKRVFSGPTGFML